MAQKVRRQVLVRDVGDVGDAWDGGTWICLVYSYRNGRVNCSVTSGVWKIDEEEDGLG